MAPAKGQFQQSETLPVGILLALSGGYMDAYTYLFRDHVFANAQTGNLVLFAVNGSGWAAAPFNRHLYNSDGALASGTVLDRDGEVLSTFSSTIPSKFLSCSRF